MQAVLMLLNRLMQHRIGARNVKYATALRTVKVP